MNGRRLLFALLAGPLLASAAAAEEWRAAVDGPRGLPDVAVKLGYPTGVVSTASSPITLRIRTGDRPFRGSVGFHIAVGRRRTVDPSVVTPVNLAAHSEQIFQTWALLRLNYPNATFHNRELVVEWRDSAMRLVASRSAGVPPWQRPQPLRLPIAAPMGTTPQWYAGFSAVETPTQHWFSLPVAVREAIFHSAVPVVFIGAPATVPSMTPIDRALIPVEFHAAADAISWKADEGTDAVGDSTLQSIVANEIATFVADENAVRQGLPSFHRIQYRNAAALTGAAGPGPADVLQEWRPLVTAVVLLVLSIAAWLLMRRRPRPAIVAFMLSLVAVLIFARDGIQPIRSRDAATVFRIRQPNVVDVAHVVREIGLTPLRAQPLAARSVVTPDGEFQRIESRDSNDLPGSGTIHGGASWTSTVRDVQRRELGQPATIRVQPNGSELIVDYESSLPVEIIDASWICGGRRCNGSVSVDSDRGRVVIPNSDEVWSCFECRVGNLEWALGPYFDGSVFVALVARTESGLTSISQIDPPGSPQTSIPFIAVAPLDQDGTILRATFALPPLPANEPVDARLQLRGARMPRDITRLRVAGQAGTFEGQPETGVFMNIPIGDLRALAPNGGVVVATIETASPARDAELMSARLIVEKKP